MANANVPETFNGIASCKCSMYFEESANYQEKCNNKIIYKSRVYFTIGIASFERKYTVIFHAVHLPTHCHIGIGRITGKAYAKLAHSTYRFSLFDSTRIFEIVSEFIFLHLFLQKN